jgi:hypothetical protein
MKIERLAGIPGKPEVALTTGAVYRVLQGVERGWIAGPRRFSEREAISAWNTMVRRIRKLNAGGVK